MTYDPNNTGIIKHNKGELPESQNVGEQAKKAAEEVVEKTEKRLEVAEQAALQAQQKMQDVDKNVNSAVKSAIEQTEAQLKSQQAASQSRLEAVEGLVNKFKADMRHVNAVKERVDLVHQELGKVEANLKRNAKNSLAIVGENIDSLKKRLSDVDRRACALETKTEKQKEELQLLPDKIIKQNRKIKLLLLTAQVLFDVGVLVYLFM